MMCDLNFRAPQSANRSRHRIFSLILAFPMFLPTLFCVIVSPPVALASPAASWSDRVAQSAMARWPEGRFLPPDSAWGWNYQLSVLLNGIDAVWHTTANAAYYRYTKQSVDALLGPDGSIPTYKPQANSLDNLALGRQLLLLYRVTLNKKYANAAAQLRKQVATQPRNASGGFWPEQTDPDQMSLDGLYMAEPFYAEYASTFQEPQDFADITKQFVLIEEHTRDAKTGLLYPGWDGSKKQGSANKTSGTSPNFLSRGMGWYIMALVDTLPYYRDDDPGRATLLAILNRTAASLARYQDKDTGLWYQVLDKPGEKGNYFESSSAGMFTYALAKGARLGYLPEHYLENAGRAWQGMLKRFVQVGADGSITITGTADAASPGDVPYRDNSYSSYVNAPVVSNDPRGVGAFLLASTEMDLAPMAGLGRGDVVMVDAWFSSQQRTNAAGEQESFHYKWNDLSNSGFGFLGNIFHGYGIATKTLAAAPTVENLKGAQFYIIVSPDIPAKNPAPHYVQNEDAEQTAQWVKQGGILIMMENDPANADIDHLDLLADRFGIHFNDVLSHHVVGRDRAPGRIPVSGNGPLFHSSHTLYMKDTCTITVKSPAVALLEDSGDIMMASAKYGNGTVFAVVDPWLYNEYTDGRNDPPVPAEYDNFAAGKELVRWLLEQLPRNASSLSQP
jgi:unsaturated rhamnogalacturonyl hydrolase